MHYNSKPAAWYDDETLLEEEELLARDVASYDNDSRDDEDLTQSPVVLACINGDLEWLKAHYDFSEQLDFDRYFHEIAAEHGHLQVVQWLAEDLESPTSILAGVQAAASHGHLEVLQWYVEHWLIGEVSDKHLPDSIVYEQILQNSAINLANLKSWTRDSIPFEDWPESCKQFLSFKKAFVDLLCVCVDGAIDSLAPVARTIASTHEYLALRVAVTAEKNDIVQWLVNEAEPSVDLTWNANWAVRKAAEMVNTKLVKWMICDSGQNVDMTAMNSEALVYARYLRNTETQGEREAVEELITFLEEIAEIQKLVGLEKVSETFKLVVPIQKVHPRRI